MKIGVVLPQTEIGNDPGAIKTYAEAVEDMDSRTSWSSITSWARFREAVGLKGS
jgi:hypothetical protein